MTPAEQNVTWLISLGVLESPKKTISDPEEFLLGALRDGLVLCKLIERLVPGSVDKVCPEPRTESESCSNIREFLRGCSALHLEQTFDVNDLYKGLNFNKVLSTLSAINKATEERGRTCSSVSSHHSNSATSISSSQAPASKASRALRRPSKNLEMTENGSHQLVVKAKFNFKQTNEDELSFSKGDILYVTRVEDGGWWEGSLKGKSGWFPSNYVREIKPSDKPLSPKSLKGFETPSATKNYYSLVVQNILDNERDYAKELQVLLNTYLRSLQANDKLSAADIGALKGNLEEICSFQQTLYQTLEECTKLPDSQQKVGGCFLNLMPQMKSLYLTYCANHPSAVNVLTQHSEELDKFMERQGASSPGILILTTSLSKPFLRLDKYPALLQELERHMEESHPDYPDILKGMTAFKNLVSQCQELRKRKQLELQILSEQIQGWEGEDIKTLGSVIYMSQVMVQCGASEEKDERYFMLFPTVLLMLSASPRMSGFIYQGKLPLTGMTVTKLEGTENFHNAFEITGNMIERIQVSCNNSQELHDWVENLLMLTKGTVPGNANTKPVPATSQPQHSESKQPPATPSHQPLAYSPPPSYSTTGQNRGLLEPPKIPRAWTLSCLRPAPPLRPSAALGCKERMSYILKDSSKSPKAVKKFLTKRKTERKTSEDEFILRKSTAALEEDAQILKVIEAYCTSANIQQTHSSVCRKESAPQVLLPEEEKIIVEETKSNGQTVIEEKSLVDTVYALKDEVQELKQENKRMKQSLEEEQKSRKELEKMIRKVLKQLNESAWDEGNH
ncbi:rho guanine nucleotide exchange factor 6 isoform X1 [Stegostoma tigrinum]|uniref:rho guanine nucleotide exchange factor 6 isoform X1 n=1 Tax=Stegostoma tigrinum TaxID=3053191 RepID=UPI00202AF8B1|nr:rho guanine nucleotide exchange factor 6 isoform X1 [Stegostoma tigrinum]